MTFKIRTLILSFILLLAGCTDPHSPEESIQLFYEKLGTQNYPELIALFNLEENLTKRESEAELYEILTIIFQDLATNINAKGGIQKIEYHSIEFNANKDQAIVRYTIFFNNGTNAFDTLYLQKDHTEFWRLNIE